MEKISVREVDVLLARKVRSASPLWASILLRVGAHKTPILLASDRKTLVDGLHRVEGILRFWRLRELYPRILSDVEPPDEEVPFTTCKASTPAEVIAERVKLHLPEKIPLYPGDIVRAGTVAWVLGGAEADLPEWALLLFVQNWGTPARGRVAFIGRRRISSRKRWLLGRLHAALKELESFSKNVKVSDLDYLSADQVGRLGGQIAEIGLRLASLKSR